MTVRPETQILHLNRPAYDRAPVALVSSRGLVIVRAVWISLVVLTIGLLVAAIPLRYQQYAETCSGEACSYLQLTAAEADALQTIGFSIDNYALYASTLGIISSLSFLVIGLLIFWRRSQEWIALLVSLWLITFGTTDVLFSLYEQQLVLHYLAGFLDTLGWVLLLPIFLFLFPDGRFVPRWTSRVIASYVGVLILLVIFKPDQLDPANPTPLPGQIMWFSVQLTGIGAQIYRYRRISDPMQRQQTRWVVYGLVMVIVILMINIVMRAAFLPANQPGRSALLHNLLDITFVSFAFPIIPLTIGVSILRYHLWDIDIIISRTLVYGTLTAFVAGIYVFIVGLLGALFHSSGNLIFSLLATGVIAVLFQPLRGRLQHGVNRLMFGERDDPVAVLSRLGEQLEAASPSDSFLPGMVEIVAKALKLPYAAIELFTDERTELAAVYGNPVSEPIRLPLTYQADTFGVLIAAPRSPGESLNLQDRKLLENIAYQVAVTVQMIRLTGELQQSRERLITTREEERRRLRRDLHDGLGPALATLSLQAEAARDLIFDNPDKSMTLMNEVIAGTQSAIVNIRQVVYGLRPPALDDLGLVEALNEQAIRYSENGLAITIEAPSTLPVLPAAVEVAIYRIVQEALTNVVRHAKAATCRVQLCINGTVKLEICDDGQGIPSPRPAGVGLTSIRERAVELGGTCRIESTAGRGTRLIITLPDHIGEVNGDD